MQTILSIIGAVAVVRNTTDRHRYAPNTSNFQWATADCVVSINNLQKTGPVTSNIWHSNDTMMPGNEYSIQSPLSFVICCRDYYSRIKMNITASPPYTVHRYMMTSSNGNIFPVTDPLRGEFTGDRWIPRTKARDAELWYFLWSPPE